MFAGLFIDSKRILETLKIVGFNPCATRIHKTLKPKISKIGLRLDWALLCQILPKLIDNI
jgi:uncharacterized protein YktB (UPF0637 family)